MQRILAKVHHLSTGRFYYDPYIYEQGIPTNNLLRVRSLARMGYIHALVVSNQYVVVNRGKVEDIVEKQFNRWYFFSTAGITVNIIAENCS